MQPFLASQDAIEVMSVTDLLSVLIDFTDVTLVSDDTYRSYLVMKVKIVKEVKRSDGL